MEKMPLNMIESLLGTLQTFRLQLYNLPTKSAPELTLIVPTVPLILSLLLSHAVVSRMHRLKMLNIDATFIEELCLHLSITIFVFARTKSTDPALLLKMLAVFMLFPRKTVLESVEASAECAAIQHVSQVSIRYTVEPLYIIFYLDMIK